MKKINYGSQYVDKNDIDYVKRSLSNHLITTGPFVEKFETRTKNFLNSKYTLSCSSGTAALHLSILSLNLPKKSIVIMPCVNFISSFNICKQLDFKIYLTDVDKFTGQMTPKNIKDCISENKLKKIDLVINMYLGGFVENVFEFYKLKKKFNFYLIEDACHAFGAQYFFKNKYYKVGSCKHCDISTFSFHPLKTITTGEGGLISTNLKKIFNQTKKTRSHGISRNLNKIYWKYNVLNNGFNYRLSDLNCALGYSQISKIKKFLKRRREIYLLYKKKLYIHKDIITFPNYSIKNKSSYHLAIIHINFKKLRTNKDMFIKYLNSKKIFLQFHYIPIYKFKVGKKYFKKYSGSSTYYKNTVSLPIHFNLKNDDVNRVIHEIKKFIFKHSQ